MTGRKARECLFVKTVVRRLHGVYNLFSARKENPGLTKLQAIYFAKSFKLKTSGRPKKQGCNCPPSDVNTNQRRPDFELPSDQNHITPIPAVDPGIKKKKNALGANEKLHSSCDGAWLSTCRIATTVNTPVKCHVAGTQSMLYRSPVAGDSLCNMTSSQI